MTDAPARHLAKAPAVAVGGIAFDDRDRVLLVRRGKPPAMGLWTVPGGSVHVGETLAAACVREVGEETGLEVEIREQVEIVERIIPDDTGRIAYHFVIVDFLVRVTGGELAHGDDAAEARWVEPSGIALLPLTPGLAPVLERARRKQASTE